MRRHKSDRAIAVLTLLLLAIGLMVIYAIGPMRANFMNSAYGTEYDANYFFTHQLVSVVLAIGAFILAFKYPYEKVRTFAKWLMVAGLVASGLLALLALMGSSLASCQLGACRWYNLGALGSFQPAELIKLGLVLYLAQLVAERKKEGKLENSSDFWLPFGVVSGLSLCFVILVQKDLGTGVAVIAIILAILWMSGVSLRKFGLVLLVIFGLGVGAIISSPHRMERLMTFGGEADADSSYHIDNAMIAIGTGGFLGVGIGNSVQATGYLPESINDSVFAVMGETYGFMGLFTVVACFTVLLLRLLKTADRLAGLEERLVVIGTFAWVMAHVVVNIAAMTGLMPLTGITLPLLSYGGTSMVFLSLALGLSLQLSCYTERIVADEPVMQKVGAKRRRMQ
ncbi:FtsW/RodA/SpoVE family cell cycle protein [Candidatus Saccharibacteria bacterium]|nr:FtsW/RodA/SpoVE family cell cycle protein [Candidatus Saccharibacteria bacterium]